MILRLARQSRARIAKRKKNNIYQRITFNALDFYFRALKNKQ